jgi:hypothetical protein
VLIKIEFSFLFLFSAEGRRGMSFVEIADSWHYEPFAENLTNINVISSS